MHPLRTCSATMCTGTVFLNGSHEDGINFLNLTSVLTRVDELLRNWIQNFKNSNPHRNITTGHTEATL